MTITLEDGEEDVYEKLQLIRSPVESESESESIPVDSGLCNVPTEEK